MQSINYTKEIINTLAIILPNFRKMQTDDCFHFDKWVTYFALITPTLDGRHFLSFFFEGDPVSVCPVGVVDEFMVWDEKREDSVIAIPERFYLCFASLYKSRVSIDVFASVSKKQSRLFGPLGIQKVGESLYMQCLEREGFSFTKYYNKMVLSTLHGPNGVPPFGS